MPPNMTDDKQPEQWSLAPRLKTPFAFIDTEAIRSVGLDWNARTWTSLAELSRKSTLRPLTTSITVREVEARIDEIGVDIEKAEKNLAREYGRLGQVVPDVEGPSAKRVKGAKKAFADYRRKTSIQEIPLDFDVEQVVDAYFAGDAPFGPGKKKDEFPDAMVLGSLAKWLKGSHGKAYVVSRDKDMKSFCNNDVRFIAIDTVAELLSLALASAALSEELETAVKTSRTFSRMVKDGLNAFRPRLSNVTLDETEFTDIEVDDVFLIDEVAKSGGYVLEVEVSAHFEAEACEISHEIVPDRDGNPDRQQFYQQRSVAVTVPLTVEVILERDGGYGSGETSVSSIYITNEKFEIQLPNGFSEKAIKFRQR